MSHDYPHDEDDDLPVPELPPHVEEAVRASLKLARKTKPYEDHVLLAAFAQAIERLWLDPAMSPR